MPRIISWTGSCVAAVLIASCATPVQKEERSMPPLLEQLLALERSALDRWIRLDPDVYLSHSAPEVTYFDPTTEARVNGLDALRRRLEPIKTLKLPFSNPRYDLLDPKVQEHGDIAVLTFNLVNYGTFPDGQERAYAHWNATQIYQRTAGDWKIIHSHWSYLRPELKQQGS